MCKRMYTNFAHVTSLNNQELQYAPGPRRNQQANLWHCNMAHAA
jgi:hypothetical protein